MPAGRRICVCSLYISCPCFFLLILLVLVLVLVRVLFAVVVVAVVVIVVVGPDPRVFAKLAKDALPSLRLYGPHGNLGSIKTVQKLESQQQSGPNQIYSQTG